MIHRPGHLGVMFWRLRPTWTKMWKLSFIIFYGNIPLRNNPSLKRGLKLKGFSVIDWFPVHVGLLYSIVNQLTAESTPWEINSCFQLIFNDSNKLEKSGGQCFIAQGPNEQIHHYTTTGGWLTFIGGWLTFILSPNKNGDVAKKKTPPKKGDMNHLAVPRELPGFSPVFFKKKHIWGQVHDMHPSKRCTWLIS